jgi:hypothetical protein
MMLIFFDEQYHVSLYRDLSSHPTGAKEAIQSNFLVKRYDPT